MYKSSVSVFVLGINEAFVFASFCKKNNDNIQVAPLLTGADQRCLGIVISSFNIRSIGQQEADNINISSLGKNMKERFSKTISAL